MSRCSISSSVLCRRRLARPTPVNSGSRSATWRTNKRAETIPTGCQTGSSFGRGSRLTGSPASRGKPGDLWFSLCAFRSFPVCAEFPHKPGNAGTGRRLGSICTATRHSGDYACPRSVTMAIVRPSFAHEARKSSIQLFLRWLLNCRRKPDSRRAHRAEFEQVDPFHQPEARRRRIHFVEDGVQG